MAATPLHSIVGMSIVTLIRNPLISLPLAVFSHILVDLYPESSVFKKKFDLDRSLMIFIEFLLCCFILHIVATGDRLMLFSGIIAANLFDIIEAFNVVFITNRRIFFCHKYWWQGEMSMKPIQSAMLDALFVVLLGFLVIVVG